MRIRFSVWKREEGDDERAQLRHRRRLGGDRLLDLLERLLVDAAEDLVEQVLLRVDVVVEAALEDPDAVGDILDRRRPVALLVKDAGGDVDDLLLALLLAPPRARAVRSVCCHVLDSIGRLMEPRSSRRAGRRARGPPRENSPYHPARLTAGMPILCCRSARSSASFSPIEITSKIGTSGSSTLEIPKLDANVLMPAVPIRITSAPSFTSSRARPSMSSRTISGCSKPSVKIVLVGSSSWRCPA